MGLNCFTRAAADRAAPEADEGLALAAAFLRSSAAAMKYASDFAPDDYEATVRPAMAPPRVREGFSGLQTRDHAYLVRVFGAVKPALAALDLTVLNIPDRQFSPLGARGIGEISITGIVAAIANAIYNATGKRVQHFPITPDEIMQASSDQAKK